jgi:hypothetical protein
LLNRPPAHCEFFASGAVVLLRHQGVPCRYVTGYVVTELESNYGDYWLARNRNAHAWAEAYDDQRRRWVLVVATPGMRVPSDAEQAASALDGSAAGAAGRSSQYPWLDDRWLGMRWASIGSVVAYPMLLCGAATIVALVVYRARSRTPASAAGRRLARMQQLLARLDRRLARRKLARGRHETLHQFARRLRDAAVDDERLLRCADWYLHYARVRYAGETASGDQLLPVP